MTQRQKGAKPARRSRKRLTVRFGPDRPEYIGYSANISSTGLMIRTGRVFPPGTRLQMEIDVVPRPLRLEGVVVWARAGDPRWIATGRIGMGLKFIHPPDNLMDIIAPIALPG
jgi:Tfp pilus assembly protein PilZ